jgi:hypothetical protein
LLRLPAFLALTERFGRTSVVECLRGLLAEQRQRLAQERDAGAR